MDQEIAELEQSQLQIKQMINSWLPKPTEIEEIDKKQPELYQNTNKFKKDFKKVVEEKPVLEIMAAAEQTRKKKRKFNNKYF